MSLRKQQNLEIYFQQTDSKLEVTSKQEESRICLTNRVPILVKPFSPFILPTGIHLLNSPGCAFLLISKATSKIFCHTGLIDPGFRGEIKLILCNKTQYNATIFPQELNVSIIAFYFSTPTIIDSFLNRPQYSKDAGFDLSLPHDIILYPYRKTTIKLPMVCPVTTSYYKPIIFGRSGMATKGIVINVTMWRKNFLKINFYNFTQETARFTRGVRICQVVFIHRSHLPNKYKYFIPFIQLNKNIVLSWANVSFINLEHDICKSLVNIPQINELENMHCYDNPCFERGENGFGSSGM